MAAIRAHTYRSLPITVIGHDDVALIAIAGYATPHERALGVSTAEPSSSGQRYRVTGHTEPVATLDEAARIIAQLREAEQPRGTLVVMRRALGHHDEVLTRTR